MESKLIDTTESLTYHPIKAEAHTPPYKIHKYFARRPWNVFNQLVNNFSSRNDIILDPFCGGGVTVYEGLKHNRKIIGCDLNPLSIFIVRNMVKQLKDLSGLIDSFTLCKNYIQELYSGYDTFVFENETIQSQWVEFSFIVKCFECENDIILSNENKVKNGVYKCSNEECPSNHKKNIGVEARFCKRDGLKPLFNIGQTSKNKKAIKLFDKDDEKKLRDHISFLKSEIKKNNIEIPHDKIPLNWDRQLEDQLAKKGIINFQDLFTEKNLLINLLLLNFIERLRDKLDYSVYELLRITFSNTIKDTNIMSFTSDTWQSGKPTTWSKHAYWIPAQFCEVNIMDAFRKSEQRILSAIKYNNEVDFSPKETKNFSDLLNNKGNILLFNKSVVDLDLPAGSVDAIITDPPYGSNVQYLELSHFWYPWNKDLYNIKPDFKAEAISNRKKNFDGAKSMYDYEKNLLSVFQKAFHALKPDKYMVLTFNNKNVSAWLALLFSIFKAGFTLEQDGIYFQDGVQNYKQTAHTKSEGSPYGDFIYVFKKSSNPSMKIFNDEKTFWEELDSLFKNKLLSSLENRNDIIKSMFLEAMPIIESFSKTYLLDNDHTLYSLVKKDYFEDLYA